MFLAPRSPTAASRRDRGPRRTERAVSDGGSRPSTPAGRPGDTLQPARPCGDRRGARPAKPPPCRPGSANFPGENRSSLSCRGAALSPRPTSCSPTPLGRQDPLKIWRPRTSLLGPLGESRNEGVRDPRLPTRAKFQLLGPRKDRAPLVQREASGSTESQFSPSLLVPQFPAVCLWQDCQVKQNRGIGRSESPGLGKELRTGRLSLPRAQPKTCLQSGAGVGATSAGTKPLRPRQLSRRGGPAGAEGTLQAGGAAFQSPVTGNPGGAPQGTSCPWLGIRSREPAVRLFANRRARVQCSETYMCNRQVH